MSDDQSLTFNGQIDNVHISSSSSGLQVGERSEVDEALMELRDNFVFHSFHEDRVRTLLENDESLTDDLNHLVIAASLMISDGTEMEAGDLKSYEMGDKIIIEERQDGEWKVARTIGVQAAQILGHARALKRIQELEGLISGLGSDRTDQFDKIDDVPMPDRYDPDNIPRPTTRPNITWSQGSSGIIPNHFNDETTDVSAAEKAEKMKEMINERCNGDD